MSTSDVDTTSPLLQLNTTTATTTTTANTYRSSFRSRTRRISNRAGLRGAVRLLRRSNPRRMISDHSVTVRETAAQQLEDRQGDWAYSTPIVVLDILWNTIFVVSAIVMVLISGDEVTEVPLRLWLVGYGVQCVLHVVSVVVEYRRRREVSSRGSGGGGGVSSAGSNRSSYVNSSSEEGESVEVVGERRQDEDATSAAKHMESANTMFCFIWWIIGFYWVSSGGPTLADDAPKLYWLTITFLGLDVLFVVICVVVACIIGIAVCCCLPCIIAILYAVAEQEGATREDIDRLPKYKYRSLGEKEKKNGEVQESFGGIMTECGTDMPMEHALSEEDAECVICLTSYEDGSELRELPCRHHFHCACIDKWLHINATCPLCKYNILKNGNQSGDDV